MNLFPKKIIGIDFHDYSAELVELKMQSNKVFLESYNRVLIPANVVNNGEIEKEDELKQILLNLFNTSNPKPPETKNVAIIFPASKVLTHIFTFPATLTENEIRKAIIYESEKIIPFSINDIYWDFMILEKEDINKKHSSQYVFFACITKQIADRYAQVLEDIGLEPELFGIHSEAIKYAMHSNLLDGKPTLIINVGALSVNYLMIKDKKIKYFFSANDGGKKLISSIAKKLQMPENAVFEKKEQKKIKNILKIPDIQDFIEKNFKRAQKIIQEQESLKTIDKIEKIILTGEFLNFPDFYKLAKIYFPNQFIEIGDPKRNLFIDDKKFNPIEGEEEVAVPYSIYFSDVIGIGLKGLLNHYESGINLLPERLKQSFSARKNSFLIAIGAIAMCAISLFIATFLFFKYQSLSYGRMNLEVQKSSLEKMIYGTRYQEIRNEITKFNDEVDALTKIDSDLFDMPILIEKIEGLLPDGITITSLSFSYKTMELGIVGISNSRESLLEAKKNFENAEFVEEVIAPISNYDEKTQISFLIKIKIDKSKLDKYGSTANT